MMPRTFISILSSYIFTASPPDSRRLSAYRGNPLADSVPGFLDSAPG